LSPQNKHAPGPLGGDEGVVVIVAIETKMATRLDRSGDVFIASRGALSDRYLELGPPVPGKDGTMLAEGDQLVGRDPRASIGCCNARGTTSPRWQRSPQISNRSSTRCARRSTSCAPLRRDRHEPRHPEHRRARPTARRRFADRRDITHIREQASGRSRHAKLGDVIARARGLVSASGVAFDKLAASTTALRAGSTACAAPRHEGDQAIAAVELAIDRVRADIAKIDPLLAEVLAFNQHLARGEGSVMKLMHDPEFPRTRRSSARS